MNYKEKVILVDCDSVLLDFLFHLDEFMTTRDHKVVDETNWDLNKRYGTIAGQDLCDEFIKSPWFENLTAYKDAKKYVRLLAEEHGFAFRVITSIPDDDNVVNARVRNLLSVFGPGVIERVQPVPLGVSKQAALEAYRDSNCIWIEDNYKNFKLGRDMGLTSILLIHPHNKDHIHADDISVYNWKQIYDYIVNEFMPSW